MKSSPRTHDKEWKRALITLQAERNALSKLPNLRKDFNKALDLLVGCQNTILISGVGKSAHIGQKIAATLNSLGKRSVFLDPTHALHGDSGFVSDGDVLIVISFSGASKEIVKLANHLKNEFKVKIISLTAKPSSQVGKISNVVLTIPVKNEGSPLNLAPMASTTTSLVMGDMLAAALTDPKFFGKKHFARFHPEGRLGLETKNVESSIVSEIPLVNEKDSFKKSLETITKYKKGIVGVKNTSGKLVGVISDGDIRRFVTTHKNPHKFISSDVMTRKPKTIDCTHSLAEALMRMEKYKITSLFVNKAKKVIGIIHMHDILEYEGQPNAKR